MPRYRQLHTKIVDSFDFNNMPDDFTRVLWLLLIVVVDSEGRGIDNPAWLRSKMFPMREDIQLKKITEAMDWLSSGSMIVRYQVCENKYFFIPTWKKHQTGTDKEGKSNLPTPDLLQSNSEVTPDLLPLNTIQYKADADTPRPGIFTVYENAIGTLTPIISEELQLAEKEYPPGWIEDALTECARMNKRSWKYAMAILKRWKQEGRTDKPKSNGSKPSVLTRIVLPDGTFTETKS